jgi:uncharacterized protein
MQRVLGLFAKYPEPGRVKTRLAAQTSPAWAARVADAFLRDTLHRCAAVAARRVVVFSPAEAASLFADLAEGRYALVPQREGSLGQRMAAFIADELQAGAGAVVLLGSDSPTLPPAFVAEAFRLLEEADVVLGPATDGGYYLLGCARRLPPIFDGINWGSPHVLEQTVACLADPAWRVALLPPWYDVDTLDDWQVLRGHLAALRRAGGAADLPHTLALLSEPEA